MVLALGHYMQSIRTSDRIVLISTNNIYSILQIKYATKRMVFNRNLLSTSVNYIWIEDFLKVSRMDVFFLVDCKNK